MYRRMRYYQSMVDADLLMVGAKYYELKDTFIIFICPFAVLDGERHLYTFRNCCIENHEIEMPDGATKILLSTKGRLDDIPPDLKAFLDYVDGVLGNDEFVQEIDREIKELKKLEEERVAYMTYAMKIQEERDEAKEEGRAEMLQAVVINMLREHEPYEKISRMTSTPLENITHIAQLNNLAYK